MNEKDLPLFMDEDGSLNVPKSIINVAQGGLKRVITKATYVNVINPENSTPLKHDQLRYSLIPKVLGKMERLAKARFEIRKLIADDKISQDSSEITETIAQSVNASSEIEGEQVSVEELELAVAAVTTPTGRFENSELTTRQESIASIIKAYFWALSRSSESFLSYEFILEIHRRMFQNTKGDVAGVIKTEEVNIEGGGYKINTLPKAKAEEFLRRLCERTNRQLELAKLHSEYSTLLATAEFIVDFLAIHPFADGNGRTARLLSTYLLERSGYHFARFYPLDTIILETRRDYYIALFNAQRNWYGKEEDLTPWISYYIDIVFVQWLRAYQRVRDKRQKDEKVLADLI
ncbi:MAG TPA: Fic family protein [Pyrinomonadaceae bacterium]|nr:Fic family protein [Pyrinomonadaceae bacterium]